MAIVNPSNVQMTLGVTVLPVIDFGIVNKTILSFIFI